MTSQVNECRIWGPEYDAAGYAIPEPSKVVIKRCARVGGGGYVLFGSMRHSIGLLEPQQKARLTTWIIDQQIRGVEQPEITEAAIASAKFKRPLLVHERAERLLQCIDSQAQTVAATVQVFNDAHASYAWSESTDWDEVVYFLDYLNQMGWIQGDRFSNGGSLEDLQSPDMLEYQSSEPVLTLPKHSLQCGLTIARSMLTRRVLS